jgi:dTDP-glucose 4,6-dehydratase
MVHYNSFNRWGWLDYLPNEILKEINVFSGDIRDPNGVATALQDIDIVFNLAALIGIPFSYHSPDTYVDTNIKGTLNILQQARKQNIQKIVQTSTSEVYGTAQFVPITEEHPINPQSPYAATKSGSDYLALTFYRSFNVPVTIVRPFNTYGPRQSARAIIPTILSQLLTGNGEIKLGSITPTRDLSFVKDTVKGFMAAADCDQSDGQVFNVGSNFEISIEDLAKKIMKLTGIETDIRVENDWLRPEKSEVERLFASNTKAGEILSWHPEFTLDQGLEITIDWFRNPENAKLYKSQIYNI